MNAQLNDDTAATEKKIAALVEQLRLVERVHPEDRERVDAAFPASIGVAGPFAIENRFGINCP